MKNKFYQMGLITLAIWLYSCSSEEVVGPNILFVITDDQSWIHTSFAGSPEVSTPNFDRIANAGIYFSNAYASAPTCTASRSSILAGQHFWRLGEAGVLWGQYDSRIVNYQAILSDAGYHTGYTGKGWGPGRAIDGPPVGQEYNARTTIPASTQISAIDYTANFEDFLADKPSDVPFSFWLSPFEPHRPYTVGSGQGNDIDVANITVPGFLPDTEVIRQDMADYYLEIQAQDEALGEILNKIEQHGLLENTMIVVTSDNGMPFPRAKSTNYEYGVRVPLAISWAGKINPRYESAAIVNLSDLAPTFLKSAGLEVPNVMTGRNLLPLLLDESQTQSMSEVDFSYTVTGFERHVINARENNQTYPIRALHTKDFVYIRNYASDRWPAGDPPAFRDIDGTSPSKTEVLGNAEYLEITTAKRPSEELYNLLNDPYQLNNLAALPEFEQTKLVLADRLQQVLAESEDPVVSGNVDTFNQYPYFGATDPPSTAVNN